MTEHITSYNEKGERHGYWEEYHPNGNLRYKGYFGNGKKHGYWEKYWFNGKLSSKGNYDNGIRIGYWEWYVDGEVKIQIFYS